jgi:hypothetical protein
MRQMSTLAYEVMYVLLGAEKALPISALSSYDERIRSIGITDTQLDSALSELKSNGYITFTMRNQILFAKIR